MVIDVQTVEQKTVRTDLYSVKPEDSVIVYSDKDKVLVWVDVQELKNREIRRQIQRMIGC